MIRWVAAALVLLLAGCAENSPEPTTETAETSESPADESPGEQSASPEPATRPGTRITVRPSEYGPMLFDAHGQAIYLFDREATPKPRCYDACAEAWPPVLTDGDPVASGAARPRMLGTTRRSDGAVQVTYGGHPLYFYAHEAPGQVLCHDIEEFGGLWLVVTPAGDAAPH
jgi:predicted lipoprotein with Yx(FWY)xxD motif